MATAASHITAKKLPCKSDTVLFWPLLLMVALITTLSGCSAIYGVRMNHNPSSERIQAWAERHCPTCENGEVSENYVQAVASFDSANVDFNYVQHFRSQPLLLAVYEGEKEIFMGSNCMAGGFPNLTWTNTGDYTVSPPLPYHIEKTKMGEVITRSQHLTYLGIDPEKFQSTERVVVVHYTLNIKRQSKRLVKFARGVAKEMPGSVLVLAHRRL